MAGEKFFVGLVFEDSMIKRDPPGETIVEGLNDGVGGWRGFGSHGTGQNTVSFVPK